MVNSTHGSVCGNRDFIYLYVKTRSVKTVLQFQVIEGLNAHSTASVDYRRDIGILLSLDLFGKTLVVCRN